MKYCTDGGERNKIATGKMDFVVTGWQKNVVSDNNEEIIIMYS